MNLRVKHPTIVAFGRDANEILEHNFTNEYKILKVTHYANYSSKEEVKVIWSLVGSENEVICDLARLFQQPKPPKNHCCESGFAGWTSSFHHGCMRNIPQRARAAA
jgi:hypothetical protein